MRYSDPTGTVTKDLGQYQFTAKETREQLDALARARGYEIVGTPTWDEERQGWNLGAIRRISPNEESGGDEPTSEGGGAEAEAESSAPDETPTEPPPESEETPAPHADELRKNLKREGRGPEPGEAAGHIAASGSRFANKSRELLKRYGVNIDDAANGIPIGHPRPHNLTHTK